MVGCRLTSAQLTQLMTQPQLTHREVVRDVDDTRSVQTFWSNSSRRDNVLVGEVRKTVWQTVRWTKGVMKMCFHRQHVTAMMLLGTKLWRSQTRSYTHVTSPLNVVILLLMRTKTNQHPAGTPRIQIVIWTEPKQHFKRQTTAILRCPYTWLLLSLSFK